MLPAIPSRLCGAGALGQIKFDKVVAIDGGGDKAGETAIFLAEYPRADGIILR